VRTGAWWSASTRLGCAMPSNNSSTDV
jgi:hypothetical protein